MVKFDVVWFDVVKYDVVKYAILCLALLYHSMVWCGVASHAMVRYVIKRNSVSLVKLFQVDRG